MKNFLITAGVCVAVLYAVDALWLNGQYYDALVRMMSNIRQNLR